MPDLHYSGAQFAAHTFSLAQFAAKNREEPNLPRTDIFRDMWTPDVVFENQISVDTALSTIKRKQETVVEVHVLDCSEKEPEPWCEELGMIGESEKTKIMLKQTARLEVNCPDMDFDNFPFDTQFCDFVPVVLKQNEDEEAAFQWEDFQLVQGKNLTSREFDLQVGDFPCNIQSGHI